MAKILLVEDDNNLREIFEMRLKAEGYTIVTAHDGEQALVVAMQEKPDLVISDVMMPKLSGFEMIETLKAAPEMKNVKVIMMTALGQAEDRSQGDKLGVDRYLVKSQVTLEDFVHVTKEVLDGTPSAADKVDPADPALKALASSGVTTTPTSPGETPAAVPPAPEPPAAPPVPPVTPAPPADPPTAAPPPPANAVPPAPEPPAAPPAAAATAEPATVATPAAPQPDATPLAAVPAPDPVAAVSPTLTSLEADATATEAAPASTQATKEEELAAVEAQINSFVAQNSTPATDTPLPPLDPHVAPEPTPTTPPEIHPATPTPTEAPPAPALNGQATIDAVPAEEKGATSHERRIEPINDLTSKPDIAKMAAEQEIKDNSMIPVENPGLGVVIAGAAAPAENVTSVPEALPADAEAAGLPTGVSFSPSPEAEAAEVQMATPPPPLPDASLPSDQLPKPGITPLDPNAVAL